MHHLSLTPFPITMHTLQVTITPATVFNGCMPGTVAVLACNYYHACMHTKTTVLTMFSMENRLEWGSGLGKGDQVFVKLPTPFNTSIPAWSVGLVRYAGPVDG